MAQSDDYKLGYSRGYNAGSKGVWPDHRPPKPPDDMMRQVIEVAQQLRNEIDDQLAMLGFEDDDPIEMALGPKIEAFDDAMAAIGKWLRGEGT